MLSKYNRKNITASPAYMLEKKATDEFEIKTFIAPSTELNYKAKEPGNVCFNLSADEIIALTLKMLERGKTMLDSIEQIPDNERTFANTILPIAQFEADFFNLNSNIMFYIYTRSNVSIVPIAITCSDRLNQFEKKLDRHEGLYKAFIAYR